LPNDGKRAAGLLARIVEGSPNFILDYIDEIFSKSKERYINGGANKRWSGNPALWAGLCPLGWGKMKRRLIQQSFNNEDAQ